MEIDDLIFAVITIPLFYLTLFLVYYFSLKAVSFEYNWGGFQDFLGLILYTYFYYNRKLPEEPSKLYIYKTADLYMGIKVYDENAKEIKNIGSLGIRYIVNLPILHNENGKLTLLNIVVSTTFPEDLASEMEGVP